MRARQVGSIVVLCSLSGSLTASLGGCLAAKPKSETTAGNLPTDYGAEAQTSIQVEAPISAPAERDDKKAALIRVAVFGSSSQPVGVPYLYGYPLYADGGALQGVRLLRQDNWGGAERTDQPGPDGVVHVTERLPALNCEFTGIQEDETKYVPISVECDLPAPRDRGGVRPVIGSIGAGARPAAVLQDPSIEKAFLGEWHAKSQGFDAGDGVGYFDTPHGLLGFKFKNGKLAAVSFTFAPPEQRWRTQELWSEPIANEGT
jgi:hypothetical protein